MKTTFHYPDCHITVIVLTFLHDDRVDTGSPMTERRTKRRDVVSGGQSVSLLRECADTVGGGNLSRVRATDECGVCGLQRLKLLERARMSPPPAASADACAPLLEQVNPPPPPRRPDSSADEGTYRPRGHANFRGNLSCRSLFVINGDCLSFGKKQKQNESNKQLK